MKSKKMKLFLSTAVLFTMVSCGTKNVPTTSNKVDTTTNTPTTNTPTTNTPTTNTPTTNTPTTNTPTTNTPTTDVPVTNDSTSTSTISQNNNDEVKCYQINFKSEKDGIDITNDINQYTTSTGVFTSFSGTCIYGTGDNSIRIGSSKNVGGFKLNSLSKVVISKVDLKVKTYGSDSNVEFKVTLSSGKYLTKKCTSSDSTFSLEFNDINASDKITIETTANGAKKRMIIEQINIYATGGADPTETPNPGGGEETPVEEVKDSIVCSSDFTVGLGNASKTKVNYDGYYKAALSDFNLQNMQNNYQGDIKLPSTGKSKLLVVPVDFSDYRAKDKLTSEEESQQNIYDTFFGATEDTGWESVKTYYEKSSYGALSLEGEVTPWYHSTYKTTEFGELTGSSRAYDPTWTMLNNVTDWAKNTLGLDITEYDTNNDGMIDGVWMVYACPEEYNNNSDIYWAYTYANYDNYSKASASNPTPYAYCWGSYNFMFEGNYGKPDAHTYIHETGHLLGLDDYYNYDNTSSSSSNEGVCGGVDMMDFNIGDHNAYSKYLMNWTTPYVVDDTKDVVSIDLKPFESSGEFILLRDQSTDKWNGSALDEYILIEYYTPTGLNAKDTSGYSNGFGTYTQAGIKIWHIDSRVYKDIYDSNDDWVSGNYVDKFDAYTYSEYYSILASNTPSYSYDPITGENGSSFRNIQLIQATGTNTFKGQTYYSDFGKNTNLFHENDSFKMSDFSSFFIDSKLNDGSTFSYTVSVGELTSSGVTIKITK